MLKRLTVAVAALFVLSSSAFGAGTVPGFSLAQQQDSNGTPLVGCLLYTIQAGTVSTPQSGYQDSALTLPLSNPIICDAYGRLPQIFLADGSIKLRLTKSNGVQVFSQDGILVVGASSGGGGGSPVDATTILATGDLKQRHGTGVLSGFVRANGRTLGSATSGATERANADTQILFEYLWNADGNLTVSTGRGASSAADWAANKTIALPDFRGRAIAGLDDMGNSASGRITTANFGQTVTVLGAAGGAQTHAQTVAEMAQHQHNGNTGGQSATHNHTTTAGPSVNITSSGTTAVLQSSAGNTGNASNDHTHGFTTDVTGSGTAFNITQPTILITVYIKL